MHKIETENWLAEIAVKEGGNLCRLKHKPSGCEVLRAPAQMCDLEESPETYGIPTLFPPNRIDAARFIFQGREYNFPLNEPDRNNHLHGLLLGKPWQLTDATDSQITITFAYTASKVYPHDFTLSLTYKFHPEHVQQQIQLINNSELTMPFGIGFHTCFNCGDHDPVFFTSDGRWDVNPPRYLPTGQFFPYENILNRIDNSRLVSQHCQMATYKSGELTLRGATIEREQYKLKIVYEAADDFKHWCLWNNEGCKGFFCPEPMTWMVNAPNMDLPVERTGLLALEPGQNWESWTKITAAKL